MGTPYTVGDVKAKLAQAKDELLCLELSKTPVSPRDVQHALEEVERLKRVIKALEK